MLVRWYSNGRQTNPAANTVLADTGPVLNDGEYFIYVIARSSITADIQIQHRDATNTNNAEPPVEVTIPGGTTVYLEFPVSLKLNERIRAVLPSGIIGDITVHMIIDRRLPWMH